MAITFDKMAYTDKLRAAGFAEEQARAMADGLDTALRDEVVTKTDLAVELAPIRGDLKLLKWMAGTNTTLTLIVLGKLLLLP
jgi:hypothetical protein